MQTQTRRYACQDYTKKAVEIYFYTKWAIPTLDFTNWDFNAPLATFPGILLGVVVRQGSSIKHKPTRLPTLKKCISLLWHCCLANKYAILLLMLHNTHHAKFPMLHICKKQCNTTPNCLASWTWKELTLIVTLCWQQISCQVRLQ